jgi:nucleoside-diphosphate-sugar epimerase
MFWYDEEVPITSPPNTVAELEERLSRPEDADVAAAAQLEGDLVVLGAGGKMGPSLARLAHRAAEQAGIRRRVMAVSRFSTPGVAEALQDAGVETVACDLLDPTALASLPDTPNVVFMAGQKFGTVDDPTTTWTLNAVLPGMVLQRFPTSRTVVFSSGNVYPLAPVSGAGSVETDPLGPIGEYAESVVARERVVTFLAEVQQTPLTILRLNYAVELRYGVLRDLADRIWQGAPVDLTMGYLNVIWQRDANAIALRSLAHCGVPPLTLNATGPEKLSVRGLAEQLGEQLSREPVFTGEEASTALLSDAARCQKLFGPPTLSVDTLIHWVAEWVREGKASLGLPTHFEEREGKF